MRGTVLSTLGVDYFGGDVSTALQMRKPSSQRFGNLPNVTQLAT